MPACMHAFTPEKKSCCCCCCCTTATASYSLSKARLIIHLIGSHFSLAFPSHVSSECVCVCVCVCVGVEVCGTSLGQQTFRFACMPHTAWKRQDTVSQERERERDRREDDRPYHSILYVLRQRLSLFSHFSLSLSLFSVNDSRACFSHSHVNIRAHCL